jgi:hypothetical protein
MIPDIYLVAPEMRNGRKRLGSYRAFLFHFYGKLEEVVGFFKSLFDVAYFGNSLRTNIIVRVKVGAHYHGTICQRLFRIQHNRKLFPFDFY